MNHNRFKAVADEICRIVTEKNKKYGDSFNISGDVLRLFYPDGIQPSQYDDVLAIARVIDKLVRIATDNLEDEENPWTDITGYGLLSMEKNAREDHLWNDTHCNKCTVTESSFIKFCTECNKCLTSNPPGTVGERKGCCTC